jgi:hypothetical protein
VGALSNQFLGRKSVLVQAAPHRPNDWVMHQSGMLFKRLDAAGYLILSTDQPYIHHLGNTLDDHWRAVAASLDAPPRSAPLPTEHSWWIRLARTSLPRRALLRMYNGLFRLLYRGGLP